MNVTPEAVMEAVAGLPERDQHLVVLRFWHGMSWEQIAPRMGFPDAEEAAAYWADVVAPILRDRLEMS